MNQTYFMAHSVSAWLGLPPSTQQLAPLPTSVKEHEEVDTAEEEGAIDGQEKPTMDWDAHMADLANRPYWSRRWIIQEFALARHVQIYCGSASTHWRDFECGARCLPSEASSVRAGVRAEAMMIQRRSRAVSGNPTLRGLLVHYRDAECKDPRDRVFALLALARDSRSICKRFPDYTLSEHEVIVLTLAYFQRVDPRSQVEAGSEGLFRGLRLAEMSLECRQSLLAEVSLVAKDPE